MFLPTNYLGGQSLCTILLVFIISSGSFCKCDIKDIRADKDIFGVNTGAINASSKRTPTKILGNPKLQTPTVGIHQVVSVPAAGEIERPRACPACSGTESQCNGVSGYIIDPPVIFKVSVALVLATIAFFVLLFAYKYWSFIPFPYEATPYFDPTPVALSQSSYGPYGQSRSVNVINPIFSLTKSVMDALDKVY